MNEYLIKKLKDGRIAKGFKQSDVTKLSGIKNTTLSNYENGVTEPDIDTFLQLCELYDLDYSEILGEAYGLNVQGSDFEIRPSEIKILKKYRDLDDHGTNMVDMVLRNEWERVDKYGKISDKPAARIINYYEKLASAGTGQVIFEDIPTSPIEIPACDEYRRVGYAIGVNGDSMEPLYQDGDILLIEPTNSVEICEIGIFLVDGEAYVKKLGNGELISLNKNRDNIPLTSHSNCMGRVVDKL